jgi:hypothetical protein
MMFSIPSVIGEGFKAARGYADAYKAQAAGFVGANLAFAAIGASGLIHLPLPVWLGGLLITWGLGVLLTLVLAPCWTALYRFAVLGDRSRGYRMIDVRTRRVAGTMVAMAFISLLGAIPFALALDVLPHMATRRLVGLGAVGFAALVKYGAFWLNARLGIAPAMAAAGTKPAAMDTSFAYTRWASFPMLIALLLVYLPVLVISGAFVWVDNTFAFHPGSLRAVLMVSANVLVSTILITVTDIVWGGVSGRIAVALVKAQRARAAEARRRAKTGVDDDDD